MAVHSATKEFIQCKRTSAKFEEKTDSPNNTHAARVMFDDTPKSSNKANFTRARLDVKTESPIDAKVARASFRLDYKVTRASFRLDNKVTTRRNNR